MKLKKITVAVIAIVTILSTFCISADAVVKSGTKDDYSWVLDESGTLTFSGTGIIHPGDLGTRVSSAKKAVINEGITGIADRGFMNFTDLTEVIIPDTLTSIGEMTFYNVSTLTTLTGGTDVTEIGLNAFYNTKWLDNQPDGLLYLGKTLLMYKGTMPAGTEITVKEGTVGIAGRAFYNCRNLTSIKLPDSLKNIGISAFHGCSGLIEITLPDGLEKIGEKAFYICTKITEITVPDSVTEAGIYAFASCSNLKSVTIGSGITEIENYTFYADQKLTDITIGENVKSIGEEAFNNCRSLQKIELPESCESIGKNVFYYCDKLEAVTILNPSAEISSDAFSYCNNKILTIYAYHGYSAETFAKENNLSFSVVPHEHVIQTVKAKEPTCTEAGCTEESYCTICDEILVSSETIPATGHCWDEGVVTFIPTTLSTGQKVYTCLKCKEEKVVILDKVSEADYTPGDVDGENGISVADARLALRKAVNLELFEYGSVQFLACDVDSDGKVTAGDARHILRAAVNLEDPSSWKQ